PPRRRHARRCATPVWTAVDVRASRSATSEAQMAGYSGTPLAKKLGIKDCHKVHVRGAPDGYRNLLEPLPPLVEFTAKLDRSVDVVHLFATRRATLAKALGTFRDKLGPQAIIWVS